MSYIKVEYILKFKTNVHLCIDCRLLESVFAVNKDRQRYPPGTG